MVVTAPWRVVGNAHRKTQRVRAEATEPGQIAAFRGPHATQLVPRHGKVSGAQDGAGGASLRCCGAEWLRVQNSTLTAKLYA